jgi:hypothetical protein
MVYDDVERLSIGVLATLNLCDDLYTQLASVLYPNNQITGFLTLFSLSFSVTSHFESINRFLVESLVEMGHGLH